MNKKNNKKSIFTFRNKKKAKHPYLIVDANRTKFKAMSLTHKNKSKKHSNYPLLQNPNKNDSDNAYLRKQIIEDYKFNFSKAFKNYGLCDEDIDNLIEFLNKKKKR